MSTLAIPIREIPGGVSFSVRVQPGAKKTAITGVYAGATAAGDAALKLSLAAPPIEGRANEALIRFFSDLFHISRSSITIAGGLHSRSKLVRLAGLTVEQVRVALSGEIC
ncbi:MAG: DUF167 domain-containing protein [Acidobacteriaceae bacterium]